MTEAVEEIQPGRISRYWVVAALIAVMLLAWLITGTGKRPLKPVRDTITPGVSSLSSEPFVVTFEQLNGNPRASLDQRIRVTGDFNLLPRPQCLDYRGPRFRWSLISGDLQLNGRGFEEILRLVPNGTTLTVDGIWRLHEGPHGCANEADGNPVWFLQLERIVQPNPLPEFGGGPGTEIFSDPGSTPSTPTAGDPAATPTPGQNTPELSSTNTPIPTPTTNALVPGTTGTPSPTPTNDSERPTLTPDSQATPTPTGTVPATTESTPTMTIPASGTGAPPTATEPTFITITPGPSPTPSPSATPTATLDPYSAPPTRPPSPTPESYD